MLFNATAHCFQAHVHQNAMEWFGLGAHSIEKGKAIYVCQRAAVYLEAEGEDSGGEAPICPAPPSSPAPSPLLSAPTAGRSAQQQSNARRLGRTVTHLLTPTAGRY